MHPRERGPVVGQGPASATTESRVTRDELARSGPRSPLPEELQPWFPGLEIVELLGAGGMGAVYKARQPRLNRFVALKILTCPPEHYADFAMRFEREAQVMARMNHPHIVTIFDFGEVDRSAAGLETMFYFLMEFVDGSDLNRLVRSGGMTPIEALAFVPQICEALQFAHDEGITHRDIKPANILVDRKGHVKIADFGLAKLIQGDETLAMGLTMTGTAMGTPHYMAPEQWETPEKVDHRADIYSLGVVIYELLTGERPAGVFDLPSKKCKVDKRIDSVVMRAMEKEPDRRFQHASEVSSEVTRINRANRSRPGTSRTTGTQRGPLKALLGLGATTVLAVSGWMLWPEAEDKKGGIAPPAAAASAPEWVKVDFDSAAPAKNDPKMELREGRLHMRETAEWQPLPSRSFRQVAQRVSFIWPEGLDPEGFIKLNVLPATPSANKPQYYGKLGNANVGGQYWGIGRLQGSDVNFTGAGRMIATPLKPGDAVVLQFAVLGESLYAWLNGRLLGAVRSPDSTLADGVELLLKGKGFALDGYEYLPLDSLSEADALKLLGVEDVVPTIAADGREESSPKTTASSPVTPEGHDTRRAPEWVNVDFASAAPTKNDPNKKLRDGRLHTGERGEWLPLPSQSFRQVAQRVSFTWSESLGPGPYLQLQLLYATRSVDRYEYYARLGKADTSGQYWGIGRFKEGNVSFTGLGRMIAPPIEARGHCRFPIRYYWQ